MEPFNQAELSFLEDVQSLARLATLGPDGTPHVTPVGWTLSADQRALQIGGTDLARTKKFRDVERTGRAALVIDDVQPPWRPRGIEVRGRAEALSEPEELIRIHPERVVAWGFEGAGGARDAEHESHATDAGPSGGHATERQMQAVVRRVDYDPEALAGAGARMRQFERAHAAQPGYAGNAVVDLGDGQRIMITLWKSEQHAAAARTTLGPVVAGLLGPLERAPSQLLGAGPVISTDLRR